MDWLKLFTLLVAVASISVEADGPKKKIRIHLPQKVKHIHHHKKIYITNHPASSQYAPAYMPSAEGTVAVPTSALPGLSHLLPLNGMDLYDDHQGRPGLSAAASHLLPLYHARGYYGPTHTEIEEQEYDLSPSEQSDNFSPTGFSAPALPLTSSHQSKRVKIIKLNEPPRKKVVKKTKPKRVPGRRRPPPPPLVEGEHPVSTFHEQFYSDLDGSATIRKVKKPPRVEKIIDGDTEHIHTYSEEHIHKLLFDENPKYPKVVGVDPLASMAAIARPAAINPFKTTPTIIAIPTNPFAGLTAIGTMATPGHFEYAAYNPRDVTHDHIFHDHGEISPDSEITKDAMSLTPNVSYNGQGLRVGGLKQIKSKTPKYKKPIKAPQTDFSYNEGIYSDINRQKKNLRPSITSTGFDTTDTENNFKLLSDFNFKKGNGKSRNQVSSFFGKSGNDFRLQPSGVSSPFSVSSTVVHDYKPNSFLGSGTSLGNGNKFKDSFTSFKDNYANNFDYDTFASSPNLYTSEDKNDSGSLTLTSQKEKKKSISKQNISFGGREHVTYVDHLGNDPAINDDSPTALDNLGIFEQRHSTDLVTSTPVSFKSSQLHDFVSNLSSKSLQGETISLPEASNDFFQYAEAPDLSTTSHPTTTTKPQEKDVSEARDSKKGRETNKQSNSYSENYATSGKEYRKGTQNYPENQRSYNQGINPTTVRGKLKYGDKI